MIALQLLVRKKNHNHHPLIRGAQKQLLSFLTGCLVLQMIFHGSCYNGGHAISGALAFTGPASPKPHAVFPRSPGGLHTQQQQQHEWSPSFSFSLAMGRSSSEEQPTAARIGITVPSQAKCEELGVREWPQQSKRGSWNEKVTPPNSLVRYVLEGTGSLEVRSENKSAEQQQPPKTISIKPGTLIEIDATAGTTTATQLEWECDADCPEMILLTPGFEEGNVFLGVIAGIVLLFGVLLSGVLG